MKIIGRKWAPFIDEGAQHFPMPQWEVAGLKHQPL